MNFKFLCDRMCAELGKWLRIAGYDTFIVEDDREDREIYKLALDENRILLTRDKDFKQFKRVRIVYLRSDDIHECAQQIKEELKIDWLYAPFSRCLKCNSMLKKRDGNWICPLCHQLFWLGSHTRSMENQLNQWKSFD